MIIKPADDKKPQIDLLNSLLERSSVQQKKLIEEELRCLQAGIKAEADAAYLIDFELKDAKRTAVIHDLRLEVNGRVAQIDHLIIHRTLKVFVLETKSFHAGVKITEEGEFLRWNDWKKTYEGMPSPLAQNERHIAVLKDAFNQIELPTRLGMRLAPVFHSLILISPKSRIDRPEQFDTSNVVKADTFLKAVESSLEDQSAIGMMTRMVGLDTLESIARSLAALHQPATFNYAAKFGIGPTNPHVEAPAAAPVQASPVASSSQENILCRGCGSDDVRIEYGKYGYYFKCGQCDGNTPLKIGCGKPGHKERIRKEGSKFFRECSDCQTSSLYYTNR